MTPQVSIVGAGPWDPELLTLAARDRLARAQVVIVDYLVNPAMLMHCPPEAVVLQRVAGPHGQRIGPKLDQDRVNELMVEHAQAGRYVVRLKGGDPMIFGRGAEEAAYLRTHGLTYEFVPGVSSAIAAPQYAGIPVTHREHTPTVSVVSGWEAYNKAGLAVAWEHLAKSGGTLVILMSVKNCGANAQRLVDAGRSPDTPAAVIRWGTRGIQRTVVGTLGDIGARIDAEGIRPPAILVVGEVVALREAIQWVETRPLHGRRVLITRSARQGASLVRKLAAAGADAVPFPCLGVGPAPVPAELHDRLRAAEDYAGLIISSPNGAHALFEALRALELDVRHLAGKRIAAIGTGTRAALIEGGLRPELVPAQARSEGLIDLLREHDLLGLRWLHLRADEGRDLLGKAIVEAGGHYELAIAYQSLRPQIPKLLLRSIAPPAAGGEGFDAVFFSSGRAARHFLQSAAEDSTPAEVRSQLHAAKVIALGPVTRAAIEALGVRVDAVAQSPDDAAVVQACIQELSVPDSTEPA